jgi:hypothetical protein
MKNVITILISVSYTSIAMFLRFKNQDLTDTKLFLQYWWFYTLIPLGIILFYFFINRKKSNPWK